MDKLSIIQVSMISNYPCYPSIHGCIQLSRYQKKVVSTHLYSYDFQIPGYDSSLELIENIQPEMTKQVGIPSRYKEVPEKRMGLGSCSLDWSPSCKQFVSNWKQYVGRHVPNGAKSHHCQCFEVCVTINFEICMTV